MDPENSEANRDIDDWGHESVFEDHSPSDAFQKAAFQRYGSLDVRRLQGDTSPIPPGYGSSSGPPSLPESTTTHASLVAVQEDLESLDEKSRVQLLTQARYLVRRLENPEEVIWRFIWENGSQRGCIRTAIDLDIFGLLASRFQKTLTVEELAELTDAKTEFLVRILRVLTAINFVEEVGCREYTASPLTIAMSNSGLASGFKICNDHGAAIQGHMSEYFRERGYKSPDSPAQGLFRWHFQSDQSYFEKIYGNPESMRDFDTFMASQRLQATHWSSWFPMQSEIFNPILSLSDHDDKDHVGIVDIGGGSGHDLAHVLNTFPGAPGEYIVQDLPEIVKSQNDSIVTQSGGPKKVQKMVHDMFKPQPIKNARVYYLRIVLHDWADADCKTILGHIADAMRPGWSRVLINELVVPEIGCNAHTAAADINMMCNFAGRERTERDWEALADAAGLYIVKIWHSATSKTSIVEMQLRD